MQSRSPADLQTRELKARLAHADLVKRKLTDASAELLALDEKSTKENKVMEAEISQLMTQQQNEIKELKKQVDDRKKQQQASAQARAGEYKKAAEEFNLLEEALNKRNEVTKRLADQQTTLSERSAQIKTKLANKTQECESLSVDKETEELIKQYEKKAKAQETKLIVLEQEEKELDEKLKAEAKKDKVVNASLTTTLLERNRELHNVENKIKAIKKTAVSLNKQQQAPTVEDAQIEALKLEIKQQEQALIDKQRTIASDTERLALLTSAIAELEVQIAKIDFEMRQFAEQEAKLQADELQLPPPMQRVFSRSVPPAVVSAGNPVLVSSPLAAAPLRFFSFNQTGTDRHSGAFVPAVNPTNP